MRLVFEGVRLAFGESVVFDGLSAEFSSGRATAIVGVNGSGKSTLLRLAGQFLRPDSGSVRALDGDRELLRAEWRRRLAAVTPTMSLYERLTAEENVRFFARLRDRAVDDLDGLLERVGLSVGDKKKSLGEYSTGMKQRLKLAVMTAVGADVWLMDEPSANLDESGRQMVISEVRRATSEGRMVLLATNDPVEATAADDLLMLSAGSARSWTG